MDAIDPRTNQELLEAFYRCGDDDALSQFLARIESELQPWLNRLMSEHHHSRYADDVRQFAWMQAVKRLREHRDRGLPTPVLDINWFRRVAYNQWINLLRGERRKSTQIKLMREEREREAASDRSDVPSRLDADESRNNAPAAVERHLSVLRPESAAMVRMVHLEGKSITEAGRLLKAPSNAAAYKRYERAMEKLEETAAAMSK